MQRVLGIQEYDFETEYAKGDNKATDLFNKVNFIKVEPYVKT